MTKLNSYEGPKSNGSSDKQLARKC